MALIDSLIKEGWLKTPRIIEAFKKIKRVDFLPEEMKDLAELNEALPIGFGQTISQPLVVVFMLEQLQPQPGEKILDIGSGSGWTSALLGEIVGEKDLPAGRQGKVIAIDIVPELVEFGRKNVTKYNFLAPYRTEGSGAGIEKGTVELICADGSKGYQKEAPYDKILVSASAEKLPSAWKEQLKIGGRIVTPIGTSIWLFIKKTEKEFEEIEYPGFVFVPLIEK
ncbi:MAG: protein-L-isoaspartate O-methyltransferase [Candidatus Nealsonbacteria bacterium]|nr:protein-L-isoaspartate O-methyltransferase [Candidatus Nealsonbacteria bacterium]